MKGFNKKLLVASFTLLFAVVATVASTFAWFTMNTNASVSNFDLQVTAGEGMMISLTGDEGTFKSTISNADIVAHLAANGANSGWIIDQKTRLLAPVTTVNGKEFKTIVNGDAGTNNVFDNLTFYFRSQAKLDVRLETAKVESADATLEMVMDDSSRTGIWAEYNEGTKFDSSIFDYTDIQGSTDKKLTLVTSLANAIRFSFEQKSGAAEGQGYIYVFDLNSTKGFGGRIVKISENKGEVYSFLKAQNIGYAYLDRNSQADIYDVVAANGAFNPDHIYTPVDAPYILYTEALKEDQQHIDLVLKRTLQAIVTKSSDVTAKATALNETQDADQIATLTAQINKLNAEISELVKQVQDLGVNGFTAEQAQTELDTVNSRITGNTYVANDYHYTKAPLVTLAKVSDQAEDGWYTGSIQLRVWVEGWDADCFDALFNKQVSISFVFKGYQQTV